MAIHHTPPYPYLIPISPRSYPCFILPHLPIFFITTFFLSTSHILHAFLFLTHQPLHSTFHTFPSCVLILHIPAKPAPSHSCMAMHSHVTHFLPPMHGHFNHCMHSLHQPIAHSCLMHGCPKLFQFTHPRVWDSCKPFSHPTHLHSSHMLCFRCPHAISLTTCGYTSPHDIYIHDLYTLHVHVYAITTYLSLHHNHTHILYLHAYAHTHQAPQAHVFSLYTIQPSEPPFRL